MRPDFDILKARRALALCRDSYALAGDVIGIHTDTHVLIRETAQDIAIAVRGSVSVENWLQDFDIRPEPQVVGWVHYGFNRDASEVLQNVAQRVKASGKPVFAAGHSKGAADVARLCELMALMGIPISDLYTFGEPRWCNAAHAAVYPLADIHWRLVNGADIVPRVPPWLDGYRHVGRQAYLPPLSTHVEYSPSFWAMALADAIGIYMDWSLEKKCALTEEHHLPSYEAALNRLEWK